MTSSTNRIALLTGAVILIIGAYILKQRSDHSDPNHAMEQFTLALEKGDWHKLNQIMAPNYHDIWGHSREDVVEGLREALQGFFHLDVEFRNQKWHNGLGNHNFEGFAHTQSDELRLLETTLHLTGKGTTITSFALAEAKKITTPFTFYWRKQPGLLGKWELVGLNHPTWNVPHH